MLTLSHNTRLIIYTYLERRKVFIQMSQICKLDRKMIKNTTLLNHLRSGQMEIDISNTQKVEDRLFYMSAFEQILIKMSNQILGHQEMASFSKVKERVIQMGLCISFDLRHKNMVNHLHSISYMIGEFNNYTKFESIRLHSDHKKFDVSNYQNILKLMQVVEKIGNLNHLHLEISMNHSGRLLLQGIDYALPQNISNLHLTVQDEEIKMASLEGFFTIHTTNQQNLYINANKVNGNKPFGIFEE